MAKVSDKANVLSDHLFLFLEKCYERCILNVERIKSLKLCLIGNLFW